ncbi:MAG: L,D-transpeptidase family protein [Devosia sp.]|nr:L,D-transpeptidase family protein [Devosia sp.]
MRSLMICLALGVALAASPSAAVAQEAVTINGVQAMRVVIAPPDSPMARIIKDKLSAAYYGANPASKTYADAQKLYYFYGAHHFDPIWLKVAADGTASFSPAAEKIIGVFKSAGTEGFRPQDYLTPAIDVTAAGTDPDKLGALETAFSTATLHYAHDAYMGRVAPQDVSAAIDPETKQMDPADTLMKLADSESPDQVLLGLDPTDPEFAALKAALAKIDEQGAETPPVVVPDGPLLRPGMKDARLAVLRQRLGVTAPDTGADVYDPALVEAVKSFQTSAGEIVDGVVGPATLAALNDAGTKVTRDDIIANMERWRWLPQDLGKLHVLVNIPEFRLSVVEDGTTQYSTRVVVGKPSTPTPIFSNSIKNIVVNPYWNVPVSIVAKEIAPHMLANPGYIAGQNMQIVSGAHVIDASAIDWSSVTQGNWKYTIRQLPGGGNALGQIKFLFPNAHDVYLHDTPSKSLFGTAMRAYSHGCVRVQNPMDFADALLKGEPNLNASVLESMFGPSERWVNLKTHVPVHIAYFTVRADADGTLHSFGDIYGHNQRLIDLLNGKGTVAAPSKTPIVSGV